MATPETHPPLTVQHIVPRPVYPPLSGADGRDVFTIEALHNGGLAGVVEPTASVHAQHAECG
eukprot:360057-Chlamydomonas_euryale.AAC.3